MAPITLFLAKSGVCLAISWISYSLLLKNERCYRFNRIFLLATMALSFAIPAIELPILPALEDVASHNALPLTATNSPNMLYANNGAIPLAPSVPIDTFATISAKLLLLVRWLYIAGFAAALIRLFARIGRTIFTIKRHSVHTNRDFAYTFFNKICINPRLKNRAEYPLILMHEKVHVQQKHSIDILLAEIVAAIQWFNPFAWRYKQSLKEIHEYLADSIVIAQGIDKDQYIRSVYQQAVGNYPEFTHGFSHSLIKKRLLMMYKTGKSRTQWIRIACVAAIVTVTTVALAGTRKENTSKSGSMPSQKEMSSTQPASVNARTYKLIVTSATGSKEEYSFDKMGKVLDFESSLRAKGQSCVQYAAFDSNNHLIMSYEKQIGTMECSNAMVRLTEGNSQSRNNINLLINGLDWLMISEKKATLNDLESKTLSLLKNASKKQNLPTTKNVSSPTLGSYTAYQGQIILQFDRGTSFSTVVEAQIRIANVFAALRNELAKEKFGKSLTQLTPEQQNAICSAIPINFFEKVPRNAFSK